MSIYKFFDNFLFCESNDEIGQYIHSANDAKVTTLLDGNIENFRSREKNWKLFLICFLYFKDSQCDLRGNNLS